jgi:hypothetical protein
MYRLVPLRGGEVLSKRNTLLTKVFFLCFPYYRLSQRITFLVKVPKTDAQAINHCRRDGESQCQGRERV